MVPGRCKIDPTQNTLHFIVISLYSLPIWTPEVILTQWFRDVTLGDTGLWIYPRRQQDAEELGPRMLMEGRDWGHPGEAVLQGTRPQCCTCMSVCTSVCRHTHVCPHACPYVCMCLCVQVYECSLMSGCLRVCRHLCAHVCVSMCVGTHVRVHVCI